MTYCLLVFFTGGNRPPYLLVSSFHPKQQQESGAAVISGGVETFHGSRGDLSARSQPEGTGACWSAQQREVEKGGCISLPALISLHLLRQANVSSALLVSSTTREGRFSANPQMKNER